MRTLIDIKALLEAGEDLAKGLEEAPRKDGGFSPRSPARVLRGFPLQAAAKVVGLGAEKVEEMAAFWDELVETLMELSPPEQAEHELPEIRL